MLFLFFIPSIAQSHNHETLNKDSLHEVARNLNKLGDEMYQINYDSSIQYYINAKKIFENLKDWESYIKCSNSLTSMYYLKRDYKRNKTSAFVTLDEAEKYLGKSAEQYIIALNNLSGYYKLTGNFKKAINLLNLGFSSIKSDFKEELLEAGFLYNLGSLYSLMGDYKTSLNYYNKALIIRLNSLSKENIRVIINKLSISNQLSKMNQYLESLIVLKECEEILVKNYNKKEGLIGKTFIKVYYNISKVYMEQRDYDNALNYMQKALPFYLKSNLYRKFEYYEQLGDLFLKSDQPLKGIEYYKKSNSFLSSWYKDEKGINVIAISYHKIAKIHLSHGAFKKALKNIQSSFSSLTETFNTKNHFTNPSLTNIPKRTLTLNILLTKSDILYAMWMESKENAEILQHAYDQYIYLSEFIHQLRFDLLSVKSKQLISEKIVSHFEKAIEISLVLYQQTNDPKHLEQAYHFAEQNKAITLQESIQENLAKGFGGIPDTTLEIEKDMRLEIAFYEKQIYEEKLKGEKTNEEHLKTFESTLFDLKRDYERLVEQLEKEYPKYYELKYKTELPKVAAIQAKLSNGSALIEFFSGEETIYAFVFTKEQLEVIELPKAEGLTDQISQFKDLINNPPVNDRAQKDFQDFTQMGFDLFENILQKPLSILPKSIQQLILIPDGELTYIPFEILLKDLTDKERVNYSLDNLSYLMEDYQVSYSFSSKLWLKNMGQLGGQAKEPFLGFAPVFGQAIADARRDCSADELYSLNCNKEEINTVHDMFGGHIFTDLAASKGNFEDQASNYQILHLATHACLDDENPMFNKIWLSDDYVSNNDLYNLSLNADLAVLSACNTGSGQLVKGEGVQSLARGFLHAGCPSLVTSLWSVDDCATSDIMIRFYEHLKEGNTKNKALQLAKLEYLKEADKLHQHPYYWSAFIQIGNPIALDFVGLNWTFIFVGLGILIVLFFLLKRKSKIEI
ncbi:MAG: CHAT domain-containing protein [Bacteroidetes bacterium]|nr:CHAT domain-containing protein [Bacteroidota bacterium]